MGRPSSGEGSDRQSALFRSDRPGVIAGGADGDIEVNMDRVGEQLDGVSASLETRTTAGLETNATRMVRAAVAAVMVGAMALTAAAQYPGQLSKKSTEREPELRAIAVLEWTGEAGKPKSCRIVPVAIYDGDKLHDGGPYLARPEPLAVADEVEYELRQNGHAIGLFEMKNAGQEQGSWVGYGEWKGMPKPKEETAQAPAKIDDGAEDDDK